MRRRKIGESRKLSSYCGILPRCLEEPRSILDAQATTRVYLTRVHCYPRFLQFHPHVAPSRPNRSHNLTRHFVQSNSPVGYSHEPFIHTVANELRGFLVSVGVCRWLKVLEFPLLEIIEFLRTYGCLTHSFLTVALKRNWDLAARGV